MVRVLVGDCLKKLAELEDKSVNCCVTSPPYFGLRDYGHEGQIGLEPTPHEFVEKLVDVFREVKRLMRDDGTLWLNLGDTYAQNEIRIRNGQGNISSKRKAAVEQTGRKVSHGLKPKDLIGIPWLVAFALQADGWYLRQDIIWHKPNPMPESVTDRCTKAHEYLFLFSKNQKYFFDSEAIQEKATTAGKPRVFGAKDQVGTMRKDIGRVFVDDGNRNKRSVWTVNVQPYSGAHFATFPPDLVAPCILAGCPEDGTVLDPFGGAGTTGLVAHWHNRNAILCELNPTYAELARSRITQDDPIFSDVQILSDWCQANG